MIIGHQVYDGPLTKSEVEDIVSVRTTEIVEHYMAQIPGQIALMLGQILHANGMALKPPPSWGDVQVPAPATPATPDAPEAPE